MCCETDLCRLSKYTAEGGLHTGEGRGVLTVELISESKALHKRNLVFRKSDETLEKFKIR